MGALGPGPALLGPDATWPSSGPLVPATGSRTAGFPTDGREFGDRAGRGPTVGALRRGFPPSSMITHCYRHAGGLLGEQREEQGNQAADAAPDPGDTTESKQSGDWEATAVDRVWDGSGVVDGFTMSGRRVGEVLVVELTGEVDLWAWLSLAPGLEALLWPQCGGVVVDLGAVTFMDAGGMRLLDRVRRRSVRDRRQPQLVRGIPRVMRVLRLADMLRGFEVVDASPSATAVRESAGAPDRGGSGGDGPALGTGVPISGSLATGLAAQHS